MPNAETSWKKFADDLKSHAWPLSPAIAADSDGWSYSSILKSFGVDSSLIVRGNRGWLVFPTRESLVVFYRNSRLVLF